MTKHNNNNKKSDSHASSSSRSLRSSHKNKENSDSDDECDSSCACQKSLLRLVDKITDLLESQTGLMAEIRELRSEHKALRENNDRLLARIEDLENGDPSWSHHKGKKHLAASPADVNALTSDVADEMMARKEKELNVVIYGLEELECTDDEDPTEDEEKVATSEFLSSTLKVEEPNLTRVFRMGRRRDDKPRPLKVMFSDSTKKAATLNSAKSLGRLPSTDKYRKVFIRPDWTKLKRDQDYARRQAYKQRNPDGARRRRSQSGRAHSPPPHSTQSEHSRSPRPQTHART